MFANSIDPVDIATSKTVMKAISLSPTQRGLFADSFISANKGVNVEQILCNFAERIDPKAMQSAWNSAAAEFDALRLQFIKTKNDEVVQNCLYNSTPPFHLLDWSNSDNKTAARELELFVERDRQTGFDLFSKSLLRVTVIHLPGEKSSFLWTIHHSIIDGSSFPIVLDRVLSKYNDILADQSPNAISQPSYLDFLGWIDKRDETAGIEYFQKTLNGFSEPTPLPFAISNKISSQYSKETVAIIDSDDTNALLSTATLLNVSLNTVLQLAWGMLIGRYSGRDDVVFGATWSGRQGIQPLVAQTVGLFINTLPVRVDVSQGGSVRKALTVLREQHLGSRPFQHTSLANIKAKVGHSYARHLFETIVVFEQEKPLARLERESLSKRRVSFQTWSQTGYPLTLSAHLSEGRLVLQLGFDTGLYEARLIEQLLDSLKILICSIPDSLDHDVHTLPILSPNAHASLTILESQREKAIPQSTVFSKILAQARQCPDSCAVVDSFGKTISYRDLLNSAIQAAESMREAGVEDGDIIAILLPRSIEAITAQLSTQLAKAVFLMLDLNYPRERLRYMLEDSGAKWMLVSSETMDEFHDPDCQILNIERLWSSPPKDSNHFFPTQEQVLLESASSERPSYIIYTSGSTGAPKGVCISEYSFAHHVATVGELYKLKESDRVLQFFAQSFDASLEEIFPTLAAGATLVLRGELVASSTRAFFDTIDTNQITVLNIPTAFWHQIVQLRENQDWASHIRLLIVGGERASPTVHAKFRQGKTDHVRWLNCYGPTEATITSTSYDDCLEDHSPDYIPIGTPLNGHSHFVLDHRMRPVPQGVTGQLYIGGIGLALGYHNQPEITKERFVTHPWRKGHRLYATGDLVWRTSRGNYVYTDRVDHQVKLRGFRIELSEIELRLQQYPKVKEAVAIVQNRPDSSPRLVAFVESEEELMPSMLRSFAAASLPGYMIPDHVVVCRTLPTTAAGKIDRRALELYEVNRPKADRRAKTDADPLELALSDVWCQILEIDVDNSHTSFFESGGNSMLVIKLFSEIERRFEKVINPSTFFERPTLLHLTDMVRQSKWTRNDSLIVCLNEGKPFTRPLFLTPGLTGSGVDYVHLANSISSDIPLYAICMPGSDGKSDRHSNMHSLTREFSDAIQLIQPKGPYALAGFSVGCIVAVAISEVLLERGEKIDFIGLIDGTPPTAVRFPSPFTSVRRLARLTSTIIDRVKEAFKQPHPVKNIWIKGKFAARSIAPAWIFTAKNEELSVDKLFGDDIDHFAEIDRNVMQSRLSMLMAYDPQPVQINATLFRVAVDPFEGPHEADLGWSRLIDGAISIEIIPGNHRNILTSAGAPELARRINLSCRGRAH